MVTPFKDYFELFGLNPSYKIDLARLDQRYHDLQKQVHPDRHVNSTDVERRLSMQLATFANEAYQTLKRPIDRARYLLQLRGVVTEEETNTAMHHDFLIQQMEWRDAVQSAQEIQDIKALEQLASRITSEIAETERQLCVLLDVTKDDGLAAQKVREFRFLSKLNEEIAAALATSQKH